MTGGPALRSKLVMDDQAQEIPAPLAWLEAFARAVRSRDLEAGQRLFTPDVVAFGSAERHMTSLEDLSREQWGPVWNATEGFEFDFDSVRIIGSGPIVVTALWRSRGFDDAGQAFPRPGRATLVLTETGAGWRCVHSHFSIDPEARS